jgi:hypothetical protein
VYASKRCFVSLSLPKIRYWREEVENKLTLD